MVLAQRIGFMLHYHVYLCFNLITYSTLQIVRPGGMERPTDAYKETHNITLSEEDTLFGGQVSTLQVILF